MFRHHTLLHMLFNHCLDSVWTCYTPFPGVRTLFRQSLDMLYSLSMHSNSLSLFGNVQTLFESVRTSRTALHAVRTLFGQCSDILYSLSMCSNSAQTARCALVCCLNTVRTVCPCLAMSEHCSDSVRIYYTPFPCVRTVLKQPTVRWCAV